MGYPDIIVLMQALVDLAVAVVLYYVSGGLWDDVEAQQQIIYNWFSALLSAITVEATAIANAAVSFAGQIWPTLENFIAWFTLYVDRFLTWFDTQLDNWFWFWVNDYWVLPALKDIWTSVEAFFLEFVPRGWFVFGDLYYDIVALFQDTTAWILAVLGDAWQFLLDFWADPSAYVFSWLGDIWALVVAWFFDPAAAVFAILGDAWQTMLDLLANPMAWILAVLGDVWQFVLDFFADPVGFIMSLIPGEIWDIVAWWQSFGASLFDFLSDPVQWLWAILYDYLLLWLEQLLADNW